MVKNKSKNLLHEYEFKFGKINTFTDKSVFVIIVFSRDYLLNRDIENKNWLTVGRGGVSLMSMSFITIMEAALLR